MKHKNKKNPDWHFPWWTKRTSPDTNGAPTYDFNKEIAFTLLVGGVAEFLLSLCVILSFSAALDGNLNQGITGSLMTLSSVIVSGVSYCVFKEKINLPQGFGILIILVAVVLLSVFALPNTDSELGGDIKVQAEEASGAGSLLLVIIYGFTCALLFSVLSLLTKHLMTNKGVAGDVVGYTFYFVEGFIGTVCLVITTLCGSGLYELTVSSFFTVELASLAGLASGVLLSYSIATGIAGVALSIFHSNAAIQTAFLYFVLGQQITKGQSWGIVLALVGTCTLTLGEQI